MSALAGQIIGGCSFLAVTLILFRYGFSRIRDQDIIIEKKADKEEVKENYNRGEKSFKDIRDTQKTHTGLLASMDKNLALLANDISHIIKDNDNV